MVVQAKAADGGEVASQVAKEGGDAREAEPEDEGSGQEEARRARCCAHQHQQSFLDDNGAVLSISKLLQAYPNAAIVLPKNYSFGTRVDNDLSKIDEEQIIAITNQSFYARFMQLFVAKKADFALIFPYTINRNFGDDIPIQVRSYRISGNPDFVSGHAICPDTINGQRVITTVNQAIRNIYKNASFMQAHLDYLPSDNHPEFISKIQSSTGFAAKQALRH